MKIQYLEIFFSRHFSDSIADAHARAKYGRVLAISDTCSAGTLFYTTTAPDGVFYGSSGWDMYSLSEGFDKYIGQPLKDRFSYRFQKWVRLLGAQKQFSFEDFLGSLTSAVPARGAAVGPAPLQQHGPPRGAGQLQLLLQAGAALVPHRQPGGRAQPGADLLLISP